MMIEMVTEVLLSWLAFYQRGRESRPAVVSSARQLEAL
jgi:hypothetical protein